MRRWSVRPCLSNLLVTWVVLATDRVAVDGVRMPRDTPAAVHVAVVRSPPNRHETKKSHLADVRSDAAPELVPVARQDMHEVRVEPLRHQTASLTSHMSGDVPEHWPSQASKDHLELGALRHSLKLGDRDAAAMLWPHRHGESQPHNALHALARLLVLTGASRLSGKLLPGCQYSAMSPEQRVWA